MKSLFGRPARNSRIPAGTRVYAVGDIHGRADLLEALLDEIARDDAAREAAHSELVFLGDLIDRGPDSATVVGRVRGLCENGTARLLKGNHEEVFVGAARGETGHARLLMGIGGLSTLTSYGISVDEANLGTFQDLAELIRNRVPPDDITFLENGEEVITIGDYLFVHAGIRPGVPIEKQKGSDLRWIRRSFIECKADHGAIVVHGHTVTRDVDEQPNRVGLDTGAYFSGKLSAMGFEADRRWIVAVQGSEAEFRAPDSEHGE